MTEALTLVPQNSAEQNSVPQMFGESDKALPQNSAEPIRYTYRRAAMDVSAAAHRRESRRPDRFKDIKRYVDAIGNGLLETDSPDPRARILAEMNDQELRAEILRLRDSVDLDEVMTVRECVPVPSERFRENYLLAQREVNLTPPCEVDDEDEDD